MTSFAKNQPKCKPCSLGSSNHNKKQVTIKLGAALLTCVYMYHLSKEVRRRKHLAWQHSVQEEEIAHKHRQPPKQRKVFVDLGANCGNTYLKHKRDVMGESEGEWEVYLWEPSPQMHEFFLNDLAKEHPNITVLPYAASVRNETLQLYVHRGQEDVKEKSQFRDHGKCDPASPYNPSGGTTLFKEAEAAGRPVPIAAVDFPAWLTSLRLRPGDRFILKLDIEGAELEILERMLAAVADNSLCLTEHIAIEFHKQIFKEGTALYARHKAFQDAFRARFKGKCGRDVDLRLLGR